MGETEGRSGGLVLLTSKIPGFIVIVNIPVANLSRRQFDLKSPWGEIKRSFISSVAVWVDLSRPVAIGGLLSAC